MSTTAPPAAEFDLCGDLPTGVAVLEASAGTGKTFAISALAARYVADGLPVEQLLIVTFTRMATSELRDRVRERFVSAERALSGHLAGRPVPVGDEVAVHLAKGTRDQAVERRDRLRRAVTDFDAATITTTHGFCQEALSGLGLAGGAGSGDRLVEDVRDLVAQTADDLFVGRFHTSPAGAVPDPWPPFGVKQARRIAEEAIRTVGASIEPSEPPDGTPAALRVGLATDARAAFERRKRRAGILTFDDLVGRLGLALKGAGGAAVADRLRERYRVVLVDEFQDTDPLQWSILQQAFEHPDGTLVLIGDPKQAIYAFRGADVYAYLDAARRATVRRTLTRNHRSDGPLLQSLALLFRDARLGHDEIVHRAVKPAAGNAAARLHGAPDDAPLRLRVAARAVSGTTKKGEASTDEARDLVAADLAQDVVALLDSGATIDEPDGGSRAVGPGDLAVLVALNKQATVVHRALVAAGVPVVLGGADSVFLAPAAQDWLTVLEALERPNAAAGVRAAALTPLIGWTGEQVATAADAAWEDLQGRLHAWAALLQDRGVAALLGTITAETGLPGRVLAAAGGERTLTDLRHIGHLLHVAETAEHLGPAALLAWLRRTITDAAGDRTEERSRRLESDARAVQILTVHRSKGLEFPIVYVPYLWIPGRVPKTTEPVTYHDPDRSMARVLDVACEETGSKASPATSAGIAEQRGEDLRLAYVALTRARHQVVAWWAGTRDSRGSALSRIALHQGDDGTVPDKGPPVCSDDEAVTGFEKIGGGSGLVSVALVDREPAASVWRPEGEPERALTAAAFDRGIDRRWRRTSFSAIVADAHGVEDAAPGPAAGSATNVDAGAVPGEARDGSAGVRNGFVDDDPEGAGDAGVNAGAGAASPPPVSPAPGGADPLDAPSPMADLPAGRHFGTLVHDVFEAVDFTALDLDAELRRRIDAAIVRRRLDVGDPRRLVSALRGAIETPLGPAVGDIALRDVRPADRLDELTFELPLAAGAGPAGRLDPASAARLDPAAVGRLLERTLRPDDPLYAYADRLGVPALAGALRGHLTGSIDLVLRTHDEDGRARYAVVDYKTNRLGRAGGASTLRDYEPAALTAAMHDAHYGLQGLLYVVALHRFLRWKVPDYDPAESLSGVLYLFLRGMRGADTPRVDRTPTGVFSWQPPVDLVTRLSDLLDEGEGSE